MYRPCRRRLDPMLVEVVAVVVVIQVPLRLLLLLLLRLPPDHHNQNNSNNNSTTTRNNHYHRLGRYNSLGESEGINFFGGIPFAAPPVGNLRLSIPEDPAPWKPHVLDATQFGPDCWQLVDPLYESIGATGTNNVGRLLVFEYFYTGRTSVTNLSVVVHQQH